MQSIHRHWYEQPFIWQVKSFIPGNVNLKIMFVSLLRVQCQLGKLNKQDLKNVTLFFYGCIEHRQCLSTLGWIYFEKNTAQTWFTIQTNVTSSLSLNAEYCDVKNCKQWEEEACISMELNFLLKREFRLAFACLCVEQSSVIACLFIHTHKSKQTQTQLSLSPEINKSAVVNVYSVVKALEIYPGNKGTWTLINVKWWLFLQLLGPSVIWNLFRKLTLVEGWWEIVTAALILQLDS